MSLRVENLDLDERLLVLLSILVDGEAAPLYLSPGAGTGSEIQESCKELAAMDPELRVAFAGTLLRDEVQRLIRE